MIMKIFTTENTEFTEKRVLGSQSTRMTGVAKISGVARKRGSSEKGAGRVPIG
jgi:hypothetical protein